MPAESVAVTDGEPVADAPRSPTQRLLLALIDSRLDAVRAAAHKRGVRLDELHVEAAVDTDERGEPETIRMSIQVVSRASDGEVSKVFEAAEHACVISKLLLFEPDVVLSHTLP